MAKFICELVITETKTITTTRTYTLLKPIAAKDEDAAYEKLNAKFAEEGDYEVDLKLWELTDTDTDEETDTEYSIDNIEEE